MSDLNLNIPKTVERIANIYPNNIAIYSDGISITYKNLQKAVNCLSRVIYDQLDGEKGKGVAFYLRREVNTIVAMLAIMKVGCYYIPLDKKYPIGRRDFILSDIKPSLILVDEDIDTTIRKIFINSEIFNTEITSEIDLEIGSKSWAYAIYTSGTTGNPKGVVINHGGLSNLISAGAEVLDLKPGDRILQYASVGFDAAGWDIYLALTTGSTLCMISDDLMTDPVSVSNFVLNQKVNLITVTPTFLAEMPKIPHPSVKKLVVMGDCTDPKTLDYWCEICDVYNGYGPTETTIGATIGLYKKGSNPKNIGKPFKNYQIQIRKLDSNLETSDTDVGEIIIGGPGVAVCYWNQPILTMEKFFTDSNGCRFYRTGDLGKMLSDGSIEFIGRIDNQVKINGVRIELEEIERLIMAVPGVVRACVLYKDKSLNAYYTTNNKEKIPDQILRRALEMNLHSSVVPGNFCHLEFFTLTPNGKVDKSKLPLIIQSFTEPSDPLERLVVEVYRRVLNQSEIGIDTNYYSVSGDSLTAFKIVHGLKMIGLDTNVSTILKYPVISELIPHLKLNSQSKSISDVSVSNRNEVLLTPYQKELFYYQTLHPLDYTFNMVVFVKLVDTNLDLIVNALNTVLKKNCACRTALKMVNSEVYQYFTLDVKYEIISLPEESISETLILDHKKPFDFINLTESVPLTRVKIYQTKNDFYLSIVKHGMIVDAFSEKIFWKDFQEALNNKTLFIEDKSYLEFATKVVNEFNKKADEDFWIKKLSGCVPTTIKANPGICSEIAFIDFYDGLDKLRQLSIKCNTTVYVILATAFQILLYKYSQSIDTTFATQLSIRDTSYIDTIGFMVSTLLVRNKLESNETISELISRNSKLIRKTFKHPYQSLGQLLNYCVEKVNPIMFVYNENDYTNFDCTKAEFIDYHPNMQSNPLYWNLCATDSKICFQVSYTKQYSETFIKELTKAYKLILDNILLNYNQSVSKIEYFDDLPLIRGTNFRLPTESVDSLVSSMAKVFPNRTAIRYSSTESDCIDAEISYSELDKRSDMIAYYLRKIYDVNNGDIVGLHLPRGSDFICASIAVWKLGAAYVPLDQTYPVERLKHIVSDSNPVVVITNTKLPDFWPSFHLDSMENVAVGEVKSQSKSDSVAYLIYTSGSTGLPKACSVRHESIVNVAMHFNNVLNLKYDSQFWNLTSVSFDISVLEMFSPLINGSISTICPVCVGKNPVMLVNWINKEKPDVIQATPTMFSMIATHITPKNDLKILVGGEEIKPKLAKALLKITPNVYNVYGPSETTIWSTFSLITDPENIYIGKPISNTDCLVINSDYQPVANGVDGELAISGVGVSNGYHNNPKQTTDRFIQIKGIRFYRTGDIVRYKENNLQFICRADYQAKINGHRIELSEITLILENHPDIKEAVATIKNHNEVDHLVAYVIPSNKVDNSILFEYLKSKLPLAMIPSYIIQLPRFPETLNGKTDPKNLPMIDSDLNGFSFVNTSKIVKPETETEKQLYTLWNEILKTGDFSVTDSIMYIGASSIILPVILKKTNDSFKISLTLEQLIKNSTVRQCGQLIDSKI